jgi:hypothetical protein
MIQLMGPGAGEDIDATSRINITTPVCAWGMDGGITNPRGYQFDELCCHAGYQGLTLCAHEGCYTNVHHRCQWAWLRNKNLAYSPSGPIYCPVHNIQRGDYIRQYYRSRGMNIPPEVLALLPFIPSNADRSDIDPSVEPGIRTAQRSAAPIGPGAREHVRAHHAVAGGETVVPEHTSALQAAAREDFGEDCTICLTIIEGDNRMRTQCNHTFHRNCLEIWMRHRVSFFICFLQR